MIFVWFKPQLVIVSCIFLIITTELVGGKKHSSGTIGIRLMGGKVFFRSTARLFISGGCGSKSKGLVEVTEWQTGDFHWKY